MSCPTCDHTMCAIGPVGGLFWCIRCGTVRDGDDVHTPWLVERCRRFEADKLLPLLAVSGEVGKLWCRVGIAESIRRAETLEAPCR